MKYYHYVYLDNEGIYYSSVGAFNDKSDLIISTLPNTVLSIDELSKEEFTKIIDSVENKNE